MQKTVLRWVLIASGLISHFALAAAPKNIYYVGTDLGYGYIYQSQFYFDSARGAPGGFAGRVFAGCKYNPYFSMEAGYTKFSTQSLSVSQYTFGSNFQGTVRIRASALDFVLKGTYPLQDRISVFGKFGIAALAEYGGYPTLTSLSNSTITYQPRVYNQFFLPTFSVGGSYEITKRIYTDIQWTRIQKLHYSILDSTDMLTAGLTYYFG